MVGFRTWAASTDTEMSLFDAFYLSVQLFVLQSGSVEPPVPWTLEVARLVAPLLAGYTAISASALLFRDQIAAWRARRLEGHVVVCGLGRKGSLLTASLRHAGERVAVVESDAENDLIAGARATGALVFTGDARDPEILHRARVGHATHVLAVTGDDGVNAEIAVRARGMATASGRALTCIVHIVDPQLCVLLRMQEIARGHDRPFRLEFFNVFEAGAREVLLRHPPFAEGRPPRMVIVGLGRMGESLVVGAGRTWQTQAVEGDARAHVVVVDRVATPKVEALKLRLPKLCSALKVDALDMEIGSPEFERAGFLFGDDGRPNASSVYVCVDDDSLGLSAALALHRHLRGSTVPVVVRMVHDAGLATLLRGEGSTEGFGALHAFGLLDRTCSADLLRSGMTETLARAMHEEYRRSRTGEAADPAKNPSMAPWETLPETLRESNRDQAGHIGDKLTVLGYALAPLDGWEDRAFEFPPEEVEVLGEMEHQRWVDERVRDGWRFAPGAKDVGRRTSPYLVPWAELPESVKEDDRIFVRRLPAFLAEVGYRIVRVRAPSGGG